MNENEIINKAIEEGAKNSIGKLIDGLSAFLGNICMPASEEIGLLVRDNVRYYRIVNLDRIIKKVQRKLGTANPTLEKPVAARLLKELIEEASWVENDTLQEMWAGILSGVISNPYDEDSSLTYIETLKKLSGFQANLINMIYWDYRIASLVGADLGDETDDFLSPNNPLLFLCVDVLTQFHASLDKVVRIKGATHEDIITNPENHRLAIGYLKPQIDELRRLGLIYSFETKEKCNFRSLKEKKYKNNLDSQERQLACYFEPSNYGLDFHMRCSGYHIYPLDAWLVTRKAWCEKKGIDPGKWLPENLKGFSVDW